MLLKYPINILFFNSYILLHNLLYIIVLYHCETRLLNNIVFYRIITVLYHDSIISLQNLIIAVLYHYNILSLQYYIIAELYHCSIISLQYYIVAVLYHYRIISLQYYIIAEFYHCRIILLQYYYHYSSISLQY